MILMVRRSNFLLVIFIIIFLFLILSIYSREDIPVIALPTCDRVIIIDAGHGSPDGGASGKSGVLEKDINLNIALKLQALVEQSEGIAIITRADDNSIHEPDKKTIRSKKVSDMKNREKIMNNSEGDIFVSIHLNKFSQSKYYGAQVFYSANNEKSKTLAEYIQKELIETIDNGNTRKAKPASKDVYLMKNADIPAVIVECGFLSNPTEEQLLQQEEYQKKLAWSIYVGIVKYFNSPN